MKAKDFLRLSFISMLIVMTFLPGSVNAQSSQELYVIQGGLTNGSCDSWANACDLQFALSNAEFGQEIWAAAGVYKPTTGTDRTATFQLKNGVELYGGFTGVETEREQRDWETNLTILSGDIGMVIDNSDNSYHVVVGSGTDSTSVLDGFIITAGQAKGDSEDQRRGGGMVNDGGSPTLTNVTFSGNAAILGGGMDNSLSSSPMLTNVTFSGNSASSGGGMSNNGNSSATLINVMFNNNSAGNGGGMYNRYSHPSLINVTFNDNSASNGGGLYNFHYGNSKLINVTFSGNSAYYGGGINNRSNSAPTLINVTFSGNSASSGGVISNMYSSNPRLTNVILWDNALDSMSIHNDADSTSQVSFSNIRGCGGSGSWNSTCGIDSGGNIESDPLFVDSDGADDIFGTADDDLRLLPGSPAIDAGDDASCPTMDIRAITRPQGAHCDMGAYEFEGPFNQPPVADAGGPYSINEGDTITLNASNSSDPDDNIVLYEWDLDNDCVYDATGVTTDVGFADDGIYGVGLKVTDDYGENGTDTAEITVSNVSPTILSLTAPVDPMQVGVVVETNANFSDPGVLDTHTAVWDWGDGSSAGLVGGYTVSGSHVYDTPGVYTIALTVTDDDGGYATATFQYVVVYDPEGGFVTGGGWIWSPEEAYVPDPSLTGKATFGFVSKYKKGATVPTGNTEFQFHVADLNFKSTAYDWLVIAGMKAQYKGIGTINGLGEYKFMLTAIDGLPDRFRIKIWDAQTEVVIYDNMLGMEDTADPATVLQGGSIVIHKAK